MVVGRWTAWGGGAVWCDMVRNGARCRHRPYLHIHRVDATQGDLSKRDYEHGQEHEHEHEHEHDGNANTANHDLLALPSVIKVDICGRDRNKVVYNTHTHI